MVEFPRLQRDFSFLFHGNWEEVLSWDRIEKTIHRILGAFCFCSLCVCKLQSDNLFIFMLLYSPSLAGWPSQPVSCHVSLQYERSADQHRYWLAKHSARPSVFHSGRCLLCERPRGSQIYWELQVIRCILEYIDSVDLPNQIDLAFVPWQVSTVLNTFLGWNIYHLRNKNLISSRNPVPFA